MDEYSSYHVLMCKYYKWNSLNTFREGCYTYDLNFFNSGLILPLREYPYVGSITSFIYYPIFLLWKSPDSNRFLGMLFIGIQALILNKLYHIRTFYLICGLFLFFQYSFDHMIGSIMALILTSVFLLYYLIQNWFTTLEIKYPFFISVVIFLSLWARLNFLWVMPGVLILFIFQFLAKRNFLLRLDNKSLFYTQVMLCAALTVILCCAYLFSTNPANPSDKLINILLDAAKTKTMTVKETLKSFNQGFLYECLVNPLQATERHFQVARRSELFYIYDIFIYFFVPFSLVILWAKEPGFRSKLLEPAISYLSFLLTLFFVFRTKGFALSMHHLILAFPFLILSTVSTIKCILDPNLAVSVRSFLKRALSRWILVFILFNLYFFFTFPNQPIRDRDDPSKIEINKLLANPYLAKNYFYVCVDWGMYYYQALYGHKDQSVLYMEPFYDVYSLKELSKKHGRKVLFIYNRYHETDYNHQLIKSSFDVMRCKALREELVWQVLIEKDTNLENVCF